MQQKSKVFYFKRWCRKNFAIFASLKRQIVISCIALGCSFLAKPTEGLAQVGCDTLKHHLNEVDVIGDLPPETPLMENALLQISISQKEVERAPIQSVSELLEHFPGVDIRQRGPFGTQADISYRGGNFDQTMLLLNGINFTDPQTGHYNLNLPISFNAIRKVELYNNTSAFLFGSSPFSGLINIITIPEAKNSLNTWLSGGMYGYFNGGAAITFKTGNVTHLLSGDYSRSDGYIHNTDFSIGSLFYQNISEFKTGKLEFQIGYSDKKYGANGFYSLRFPDQYETVKTGFGSILYRYKKRNIEVIPSLYYRVNADCFELIKNQSVLKNNYHLSQIGGANLLTAFYTKGGKTSLSIDARMEDILSTSLGETIRNPVPTFLGSVFYNHR
ncbi:MAG: TonB-dependent receptor plug domain-containing protein, partial [Bacteroidales bacterium]|nr:TonB-dependent receptor plug domain-containing protein [Bacteroidales bacterium]